MSIQPSNSPCRVVLLTSPGLYGAAIINTLVETEGLDIVGVGLTNRVFKGKGPLATLIRLIRRNGFAYTWNSLLVMNVAWLRLRLSGRPTGLTSIPKQDVRYITDINAADTVAWMKSLTPDFVASFYFNQWIGKNVREVPRADCVNLHPSLLPELRGPDPIFRMLEQGRTESGVTLHRVADEFDAGEILHQATCPVPHAASMLDVYFAFVEHGASILAQWLAGRITQPAVIATSANGEYSGFPTACEVRALKAKGIRLGGVRELRRLVARIA